MTTQEKRLFEIGETLREVATDLEGVSDTLSALKVVAANDRVTPRTLQLLQNAVNTAIYQVKDTAKYADECPA
jgi:hypothetical protein